MMEQELMWTVTQVAEALHLSERSVWRMAATGQLPRPIRIGRAVRWSAASLRRWLAAKEAAAEKKQAVLQKNA